jgi:hypothetical protein
VIAPFFFADSSSSVWSNPFLAFHLILFGTILVGGISIGVFHFTSKLVLRLRARRSMHDDSGTAGRVSRREHGS